MHVETVIAGSVTSILFSTLLWPSSLDILIFLIAIIIFLRFFFLSNIILNMAIVIITVLIITTSIFIITNTFAALGINNITMVIVRAEREREGKERRQRRTERQRKFGPHHLGCPCQRLVTSTRWHGLRNIPQLILAGLTPPLPMWFASQSAGLPMCM